MCNFSIQWIRSDFLGQILETCCVNTQNLGRKLHKTKHCIERCVVKIRGMWLTTLGATLEIIVFFTQYGYTSRHLMWAGNGQQNSQAHFAIILPFACIHSISHESNENNRIQNEDSEKDFLAWCGKMSWTYRYQA